MKPHHPVAIRVSAFAVVAFLTACSDGPPPTGSTAPPPEDSPSLTRSAPSARSDNPSERLSQRLARLVPAFGGAFVDEQSVVNVHLTDLTAAAVAEGRIMGELRRSRRADRGLRVIKGQFTFAQLERWHLAALPVFSVPGVVFTEIDERTNRLRIGVADDEAHAAVRARLAALGIPSAGAIIERARPMSPAVSLSDRIRPLTGGTRIFPAYEGQNINSFCTYNVNVLYGGVRHMVVNSHCTQPGLGGYVGAHIHQHELGPWWDRDAHKIGVEEQDPAFTTDKWGCPSGYLCRYSDAALVRITTGDNWNHGGIARPIERVTLPTISGSKTIDSGSPSFQLAGVLSELLVGDVVEKVGARTGWTGGVVESTCRTVTMVEDGTAYAVLCSGVVDAGGGGGDSGAPVFWRSPQGGNYLVGILYAVARHPGSDFGSEYAFSNWSYVDYELGLPTADLYPIAGTGNTEAGCTPGAGVECPL